MKLLGAELSTSWSADQTPLSHEVPGDILSDARLHFFSDGRDLEELQEPRATNISPAGEGPRELAVLFPAGDVLGDREVVRIEAESADSFGVAFGPVDEAALPSFRQPSGRGGVHRVGVGADS